MGGLWREGGERQGWLVGMRRCRLVAGCADERALLTRALLKRSLWRFVLALARMQEASSGQKTRLHAPGHQGQVFHSFFVGHTQARTTLHRLLHHSPLRSLRLHSTSPYRDGCVVSSPQPSG
jgi:hypothetical protein